MPCSSAAASTSDRRWCQKLGCAIGPRGTVETGKCESTNVPGLFVAGDASDDAQLVVVAAAEGAEAAIEINRSLSREDFERRDC